MAGIGPAAYSWDTFLVVWCVLGENVDRSKLLILLLYLGAAAGFPASRKAKVIFGLGNKILRFKLKKYTLNAKCKAKANQHFRKSIFLYKGA